MVYQYWNFFQSCTRAFYVLFPVEFWNSSKDFFEFDATVLSFVIVRNIRFKSGLISRRTTIPTPVHIFGSTNRNERQILEKNWIVIQQRTKRYECEYIKRIQKAALSQRLIWLRVIVNVVPYRETNEGNAPEKLKNKSFTSLFQNRYNDSMWKTTKAPKWSDSRYMAKSLVISCWKRWATPSKNWLSTSPTSSCDVKCRAASNFGKWIDVQSRVGQIRLNSSANIG